MIRAAIYAIASLAQAVTIPYPLTVTPYANGIAIQSGAQVYVCPVPIAGSYDGAGLVVSSVVKADRVFGNGFN